MTEREIICETLIEIFENGAFAGKLLDDVLSKYAYLEPHKRAFISREVTGVTERYIELDGRINSVSKTKVNKMKPLIRTLLRMGCYEICYMDKVPASASCNEMVKLARKRGFSGLSGFVNGVLRTISRDPDATADALTPNEKANMPKWIYDMWRSDYGAKTDEICQAYLSVSPLTIRVNSSRTDVATLLENMKAAGVDAEVINGMPAIRVLSQGSPEEWPGFAEGLFYIQDISSMMDVLHSGAKPGDYVLDCCAAPGGKSTFLAELVGETGHVTAWDVSAEKTGLISQNAARLGHTNINIEVQDATISRPELIEKFDLVLADVPCSGLGVLGKKPDIRLHASMQEIDSLVSIQASILETVSAYVRRGGILTYSTCTISKKENERQVEVFLAKHSEYRLVEQNQWLPDIKLGNDGFYSAVMEKIK